MDEQMLSYWWKEQKDKSLAIAVNDKELAKKLIELDGTHISEWNIGTDFRQWIGEGGDKPEAPDLLQGEFLPMHKKNQGSNLKAGVIIAFVAALLFVGFDIVEMKLLENRQTALQANMTTLFKKSFPETRRNFTYSHYMSKIERLKSGVVEIGDFQLLLAEVALALPVSKATLIELGFKNNKLDITCIVANFEQLNLFQQHLSKNKNVKVRLKTSGSREGKVTGQFQLVLI